MSSYTYAHDIAWSCIYIGKSATSRYEHDVWGYRPRVMLDHIESAAWVRNFTCEVSQVNEVNVFSSASITSIDAEIHDRSHEIT